MLCYTIVTVTMLCYGKGSEIMLTISEKEYLMKTLGIDSETFEVYKRAGLIEKLERSLDFGRKQSEPRPHFHGSKRGR